MLVGMWCVMMHVVMMVVVGVTVLVWVGHSCPTFSGRILFSLHDHINFGRTDPAPIYPRDLQTRPDLERLNGLLEDLGRNSSINQCAQKHIAADSGKAVEVCDPHRKCRWSLVVGRTHVV